MRSSLYLPGRLLAQKGLSTFSLDLAPAGGALFLTATSKLWKSDGSTGGTAVLVDTGLAISLAQLTPTAISVYFQGDDDVWVSDGTAAGTLIAADFPDTISTNDSPAMFTAVWRSTHFHGKERLLWS